jgi:DNA invertase Pin-like site-specific DNA recombinase
MDKFNIWAYLRVSTGPQENSLATQLDLAKKCAEALKAQGGVTAEDWCFSEISSASDNRYNERPAFSALMRKVRKHDHIVIYAQDRLDRDPLEALNCLRWMSKLDVTLHLTKDGTGGQVMHTLTDTLLRMLWSMNGAMSVSMSSERLKSAMAFRKANGLCWNKAPWGRKVKKLRQQGKNYPYKIYVWDEHQMALIRELKQRHDAGEQFLSIAKDFHARGERTQNGGKWLYNPPSKSRKGSCKCVAACYKWYKELLASGKDMGDDPVINLPASVSPDHAS